MVTPELSLVVPLHNEEHNVEPLVAACTTALSGIDAHYELILVDDGSTDGTLARLRDAVASDPHIRAISLRRRFGKGAALAAGLKRARGDRIATLDADLQEDPAELRRLLGALDDGLDLVTGWRRQRRDPWLKRISSRLFNTLVRLTAGLPLRDINCGFKAMRREVAEELILTGGRFRFIPLLAHWWGFRVGEIEVSHRARARGRSSFGAGRFPGVLIDLLAVSCLIRYHSRPGHLFVQTGAVSFFGGLAICSYIAWLRVSLGSIGFRYPLLALGVLLIAIGVQLAATGFLGEWLAYRDRNAEPGFRVRWESPLADDTDGAEQEPEA